MSAKAIKGSGFRGALAYDLQKQKVRLIDSNMEGQTPRGMDCERYDILLVDAQGEAKQKREWTETQLLGSVAWLKRMNARDYDVLIRPSAPPRLAMLDRMTRAEVLMLQRLGVPCSAQIVVEPDRFQVCLNLGSAVLSERLGTVLARKLHLPSPHVHKFGALAGFVTHSSDRLLDQRPLILAHE